MRRAQGWIRELVGMYAADLERARTDVTARQSGSCLTCGEVGKLYLVRQPSGVVGVCARDFQAEE